MAPNWDRCCGGGEEGRSGGKNGVDFWKYGWKLSGAAKTKEMLVPDVSRVSISISNSFVGGDDSRLVVDELLGRKRRTNLSAESKVSNALRVRSEDYDAELTKTLKDASSEVIDGRTKALKRCVEMKPSWTTSSTSRKSFNETAVKLLEEEAIQRYLGDDFPYADFPKSKSIDTFVIYVHQSGDEYVNLTKSARETDSVRQLDDRNCRNHINNSYDNHSRKTDQAVKLDLFDSSRANQSREKSNQRGEIEIISDKCKLDNGKANGKPSLEASEDHRVFRKLCRCFRLFSVEGLPVRGLHNNGLLTFGFKGKKIVLIGTASRYGKLIPEGVEPVKLG